MIADSPYQVGEPVMKPWQGLLAGLIASLLMLLLVYLLQPISSISLEAMLQHIGGVVVSSEGASSAQQVINSGLILHLIIGIILGLLYALSQNQVPARGLIGVGVFYGFLLWVVGSVLIGAFFGETLRAAMRSLIWFLACLLFGLSLGVMATWILKRNPAAKTITVLD